MSGQFFYCVQVFNYEGIHLRQIGGESNNQIPPPQFDGKKSRILLHNSLKCEPKISSKCLVNFI